MVVLQFNLSLSIDVAEEEVQSAINAAQSFLPSDLPAPPIYSKTNPADAPVLTLGITSKTLPLSQVEDDVDTRLAPKISQLSGVGLVSISGGQKPADVYKRQVEMGVEHRSTPHRARLSPETLHCFRCQGSFQESSSLHGSPPRHLHFGCNGNNYPRQCRPIKGRLRITRVCHSVTKVKMLQSQRDSNTIGNRQAANLLFFPRSASYFLTSPSTPERNNLNDQILNAIDEEIAKLRQARAILTDAAKTPVSKSATTASPALLPKAKTRRKLSAKARKAIADAQRKRWAKVKSQKKAAAAAVTVKKEPAAS